MKYTTVPVIVGIKRSVCAYYTQASSYSPIYPFGILKALIVRHQPEIRVFLLNETWVARLLTFQKLTSPLKINGWKMYFPNEIVLF